MTLTSRRFRSIVYRLSLGVAFATISSVLGLAVAADTKGAQPKLEDAMQRIDQALNAHWAAVSLSPADAASAIEWQRRVTLDLIGRPPTAAEVKRFETAKNERTQPTTDRQAKLVDELLESAEFSLYFGSVLDEIIQGRQAGNETFVDYLRQSLIARKSWDRYFREIVGGEPDTGNAATAKAAALFYDKRVKEIDQLTVDTARSFFGVDISCARCHDHPLVSDWTQFHYYGLVAFLQRPAGKAKDQNKDATERDVVEVKFLARDGKERTAGMMFLSGKSQLSGSDKSASERTLSPRERLVAMAMEDRTFLSRSLVNRLWDYFHGRGLVEPVDQMHSGNPASIPAVLDLLADDFVANGYDLRRTIRLVVLNRAYRASSRWDRESAVPDPKQFAVMQLKPLTPRQLALSLLTTVGPELRDEFSKSDERLERVLGTEGIAKGRRWLEWEAQIQPLLSAFDPRTPGFQSSAREALFVSNGPLVRQWIGSGETRLAARAAQQTDDRRAVETVFRSLVQRSPTDDEWRLCQTQFAAAGERTRLELFEDLVWAITASVEFRFNH